MKSRIVTTALVLTATLFLAACAHLTKTTQTAQSTQATQTSHPFPGMDWDGKSPNLDPSCQGFGC